MPRPPKTWQQPRDDRPVSRRTLLKALGLGAAGAAGGFGLAPLAQAAGATQRPISDFLGAQGRNTTYVKPSPDFVGWYSAFNTPPVLAASVDYAGLSNAYLEDVSDGELSFGTTTAGSVTERKLADGRAEVTVVLHTKNALAYAFAIDFDIDFEDWFGTTTLLFGYRLGDVIAALAAGADITPALGESQLKVVLKIAKPGDPLPDLSADLFTETPPEGVELVSLAFRATAFGPLRTADGGEGGPGKVVITQTGLFQTKFKGATADAFPAEKITIEPVGK